MLQTIYKEFLGLYTLLQTPQGWQHQRDKARWHLENIVICDMCYVRPYICEYYYRIDEAVKPQYREMFYNKLPINVGNILKEEWRTRN